MAEFVARIKPRRSSTSGETPNPSDLTVAELAVNTADGILFTKHTDGTIKAISGSGGGGGGGSAASIEGIGNVLPRSQTKTDIRSWDSKGDTSVTGGWSWTAGTQLLVLNKESKDGTDIRLEVVNLPATGTLFYSLAGGTGQSVYVQVPYLDLAISGETVTLKLLVDGGGGEARDLVERIWTSRNVDLADEIWISFDPSTDEEVESKTNDFLIYDESISKWVIKEGGIFNLSDTPDAPDAALNEQALVWDNIEEEFKFGFPVLSTVAGNATSGKTENRLLGPGSFYASTAFAEAAGWINTSIRDDDSQNSFKVPAAHVGKVFLGQTMPEDLWVNTNGALSFDFEGRASKGRLSDFRLNAVDDIGYPIQFYLSLMAQDVAANNVYYKTIINGWVVRCEWKVPYGSATGIVTEVTFYDFGKIRVSYGAGQPITINSDSQGIRLGRDDINVVEGWDSFVNNSSAYSFVIQPSVRDGRVLKDLADVSKDDSGKTQGATLVWEEDAGLYIPKIVKYSDIPEIPQSLVESVNGETGVVSLGIQDMDDADTETTTPTEGQALIWDDADSKWKPGTVGGGAVDSVNGETGVVSLGIQDMDDYSALEASSVSDPVVWSTFENSSGADRSITGRYGTGAISGGDRYVQVASKASDGTDYASFFDSITTDGGVSELGTKSGIAVAGTEYSYFTLVSISKRDEAGYSNPLYTLRVSDPSGEFSFHYSSIDLDFSRIKTGIDLTEGDILQWNDTDQKFKPAQLPPGGSGAVDSVNGETGVVSLGIQDMDDYRVNLSVDASWLITGSADHASGMLPGGGYVTGTTGTVAISPIDALGTDRAADMTAWMETLVLPATVTFDFQGTEYPASVKTTYDQSSETGTYKPRFSFSFDADPFDGDRFSGQKLRIAEFTSYLGAVGVPLAEGDILRWNDADQKFKPAQLPAGGGGGRVQDQVITNVFEPEESVSASANIGKSGTFVSIETDRAAWVIFYATESARTLDSSRAQSIAPLRGSGVLLEVLTTGAETILVTPTVGFFNAESLPVSQIPMRIVNKSTAASAVAVTVDAIRLEP